ncbi:MAG: SRPBCC domain-containing protein [Chloroflexota bacterium]
MTVTAVRKDIQARTLGIDAEFQATPERVWQLWADPRQLERWWGPPMWPATFTQHALTPGGQMAYHMTGPDGSEAHGWWHIVSVEPPRRITFRDGFGNADGTVNESLPVTDAVVTIEDLGGGRTRMSVDSTYQTIEALEQVLAMGMEEGLTQAVGQIDAILADTTA